MTIEDRTILWRAEHEKTGYEHRAPVTAEAIGALEEARSHNRGAGDARILPVPRDPSTCVSRARVAGGWKEAQTVLRYYQHTAEVQLRTALDTRDRAWGPSSRIPRSRSDSEFPRA